MSINTTIKEQKEISSSSATKAFQSLKTNLIQDKEEEKIIINKEFKFHLMNEFELTSEVCEKYLKQNKGDLEKTIIYILNKN